jgi:hypothetical protein
MSNTTDNSVQMPQLVEDNDTLLTTITTGHRPDRGPHIAPQTSLLMMDIISTAQRASAGIRGATERGDCRRRDINAVLKQVSETFILKKTSRFETIPDEEYHSYRLITLWDRMYSRHSLFPS